jgi:RimJ/RimL family protein N-acetyltransferase
LENDVVRFETERLVLRRWTDDDVEPMARMNAEPQVMQWTGDGSVIAPDQTAEEIAQFEQRWEERGFGLFAVEFRETGELAGFAGLSIPKFLPEVLPAVGLGCRFAEKFWGRGVATEALIPALSHGFVDCGLDRIVTINQVTNDASARILQKLGMKLDRHTIHPVFKSGLRVYSMTRAEHAAGLGKLTDAFRRVDDSVESR